MCHACNDMIVRQIHSIHMEMNARKRAIALRDAALTLTPCETNSAFRRCLALYWLALFMLACAFSIFPGNLHAAGRIQEFIGKAEPAFFFADADRFGEPAGDPPLVPVYRGQELRGHVFLNSDFANATGYSGKPIHIIAGIDASGILTRMQLVDHKEPIVLIGIPEARIIAAMNVLVGRDIRPIASGVAPAPQVDIVSGATVTVLVMADSVVRGAVRIVRTGRLGSAAGVAAGPSVEQRSLLRDAGAPADWETLLGNGSVRRLNLSVGEVSAAFAKAGKSEAARAPENDNGDATFIELYAAPVSIPAIGRSLLGDTGFAQLQARLKPGQEAILVVGEGEYSFKGSGYVRGGIFDRIELIQDGQSVRFRDRNHTRLGAIEAAGAPTFREIALFVIPEEFKLDLTQPWQIQLLAQRNVGARDKAFVAFDLDYALPESFLKIERRPAQPAPPQPLNDAARPEIPARGIDASASLGVVSDAGDLDDPLWMKIWKGKTVHIAITVIALLVLTVIFFFQDWLVKRPVLYTRVRLAYLAFILVWLGWYANAQLSVVNVITFTSALIHGFNWEFFLAAPLIFILWSAVAAGLLFWGRGPFCGWLCPFGALQELLNAAAKRLRVPQITVPWGLHERLWPVKYMIFLGLFGTSLYSVALAEQLAEVEPFKTAIVLKFVRDWPYVIYALTLLSAGLFIERFFCRYLCPLGAALAIPGRIRMFEWLKRWPECGSPCQRCAKECPVQSIHPEGQINVNECIYCMHCQELYQDDQRCPHMIQVRLKREKRDALMSPAMRTDAAAMAGRPPKTTITHQGAPVGAPQ